VAEFTHLDDQGRARMVDVGGKELTRRVAEADSFVSMSRATRDALFTGAVPKGDALAVTRLAGIMAAKRTSELLPLCHPIGLTSVSVDIEQTPEGARIVAVASTDGQTGVEMEALTAASVAALALYDMLKALERAIEIGPVRLVRKSGGRSGEWHR